MAEAIHNPNEQSPLKRAFIALERAEAELAELRAKRSEPIAVVGMACRFPGGADTLEAYWRLLSDGRDAVGEFPADRWSIDEYFAAGASVPGKMYVRNGAFLHDIHRFDPQFFNISPREAELLDPQHRLLLQVAWEALEHAGQAPDELAGTRTGVFIGICKSEHMQLVRDCGPEQCDGYFASGGAASMAAGRISYLLGLEGPSLSIDTACSSSLVALYTAVQSLRAGECDAALVGGVNLILSPHNTISFCAAGMVSHTGRCRTFSSDADGFVQGEGCGVVVLRRLSDARQRGDRILAVVRATAVNHDGASSSLTAPSGPAQQNVIQAALNQSGLTADQVQFIEAHGTGTSLGDPIEVQALGAVYGRGRALDRPLLLGAVKSQIGHLEAAAGIAGFIKLVLCLERAAVPAQLHCAELNPHIDWDRWPVQVAQRSSPWPANDEQLRVGAVSSFGFSGTNAHVIVAQAKCTASETQDQPLVERSWHVLPLSAPDEHGLRRLAQRYDALLSSSIAPPIANLCFTAGAGRAHHRERLAIVGQDLSELRRELGNWKSGRPSSRVCRHRLTEPDSIRIAFAFTGQGGQYPGMCRRLYECEPTFRRTLAHCLSILEPLLEVSPQEVLRESADAANLLQRTDYAQPLLFAVEYALAELLMSWGIQPAAVLGHSLGQYVAGCIAGVFSLKDGLRIVAARGRLMHAHTRPGAMAALFAAPAELAAELSSYRATVSVAAVNGAKNTVISGASEDVAAIVNELTRKHVGTVMLDATRGFHSPLIEPALAPFAEVLQSIRLMPPTVPLVCNVTGQIIDSRQATSVSYWIDHARQPVQFHNSLSTLAETGCQSVVEIGPRPILTGMAARAEAHDLHWTATLRKDLPDDEALGSALADLYIHGVKIDWRGVYAGRGARLAELPSYPFAGEQYPYPLGYAGYEQRRRTPATLRAIPADVHPLLGERISTPLADVAYEVWLDIGDLPFAADHRVGNVIIFPAAGFLAMAYAAACRLWNTQAIRLRDISIASALELRAERPARVQLTIEVDADQTAHFRISSFEPYDSGIDAHDGRWVCHMQGQAQPCPTDAKPDMESWRIIQQSTAERSAATSAAEFYASLDQTGLHFGAALQGVRETSYVGPSTAVGRIQFDVTERAQSAVGVDPATLDACLQVLAAAAADFPDRARPLRVPMMIREVTFYAPLPRAAAAPLWSYVRETTPGKGDSDTVEAHVDVFDEAGNPRLALEGLLLSPYAAAAPDEAVDSLFYHVQWEQLALPGDDAVTQASSAATLLRLASHRQCLQALDKLAVAAIVQALQGLGTSLALGDTLNPADLSTAGGVCPAQRRLMPRLVEILATGGVSARLDSAALSAARQAGTLNLPAALNELAAQYPASRAEIELFRRCAISLAAALRGEADPLELLFPGGSLELAEAFYHRSPSAAYYNAGVARVAADWLRQLSLNRPVRILEVGGGTGGTTIALLSEFAAFDYEYTFTDVSPAFVTRARTRFAGQAQLRFATFDLERPASEQNVPLGEFDLIVAANCIHATQDIRATLKNLRSLLTSGGALLLTEITSKRPWIDLTFGLTDGWWRFGDLELRPDYPLLSVDAWRTVLGELGWKVSTSSAEIAADDAHTDAGQAVMLAAPELLNRQSGEDRELPVANEPPDWLIVANEACRAEALAQTLAAVGQGCARVVGGPSPSPLDAHDVFTLDFANPDEFARLLNKWSAPPRRGVVCLWSTPSSAAVDFNLLATRATLHLTQALLRQGTDTPPPLWIVTWGAVPASDGSCVSAPDQATLWGLGKVIRLEHPELRCTCIDLDPQDMRTDLTPLSEEFAAQGNEREIAWRNNRRFAPRLVRGSAASKHTAVRDLSANGAAKGEPGYLVAIRQHGDFDQLEIVPQTQRSLGPHEVEILVAATGVNFRDVLNTLGLYPGAPPLGAECAGVVSRIGEAVTSVRPGDRVVAIGPGCLASHVIVGDRFVAPMPRRLTLPEASAIAIPFVTAAFSLHEVAGLRSGQRVLIHAAAGGVGLAAVQLAQRIGADVFATAGSPEKRSYLKSLGVEHVFNSRTTAFADEISKITGGRGVDVILNSLNGAAMYKSLDVLARGGSFVELGKRDVLSTAELHALRPDVAHTMVDWGQTALDEPARIAELFQGLMRLVDDGALAPLPTSTYPVADMSEALRYMAAGKHVGRLSIVHSQCDTSPVAALRSAATYLITGGLGGLGFYIARDLIGRGAKRLVLVGRRSPSDEQQSEIDQWRDGGVDVQIVAADVSDRVAMESVVALAHTVEHPLRGVIHAAGALHDGVLLQQTWANFETVFAAKVQGARHLHELTADVSLDFFLLFSSIASVLGSPGQANHAAANAYMDALAHYRRARGLPATSINWGIWSDTGAAARLGIDADAPRRGLLPFSPSLGVQAMHKLLAHPTPQAVVMRVDWPALLPLRSSVERHTYLTHLAPTATAGRSAAVANAAQNPAREAPSAADTAAEVRRATPQRRRILLQAAVEQMTRKLLRLAGSHVLELSVPLREYGLDSLMAVEMRNLLSQKFDCALPSTLLFEAPSIESLADYLDARVAPPTADASSGNKLSVASATARSEASAPSLSLLDEIEGLTDDEIDRQLTTSPARRPGHE